MRRSSEGTPPRSTWCVRSFAILQLELFVSHCTDTFPLAFALFAIMNNTTHLTGLFAPVRKRAMEEAVKQAIDEDDAQQLYEVLQQHAKMGRIDLIIDKLYDGLRGRTCLHRYQRKK